MNNLIIEFDGKVSSAINTVVEPAIKRRRRSFNPPDTTNHFKSNLGKRVDPGILNFPQNEEKVFLFAVPEREHFIYTSVISMHQGKLFQVGLDIP